MIYQYQQRSRRRPRPSILGNLLKIGFFFFVVAALFATSYFLLQTLKAQTAAKTQHKLISPIVTKEPEPTIDNGLKDVVQTSLAGTKGTYAVAIKNLATGETYYQNEHRIYETASLYKLWIMLTVFDQIKQDKLTKDTVLKDSVQSLNDKFDIASEEAELTDGDVELSVGDALEKMITISDNYAALLLTARVRLSTVNQELVTYGFSESKLDPPMATASDILKFYEKLYNGELIDKSYSKQMTDLLLQQELNDRIPKYLPQSVDAAHKTGEIDGYKHDAGIVYTKKGDYIIVLLSRSDDPLAAAEREALLSRDVYNYFQSK